MMFTQDYWLLLRLREQQRAKERERLRVKCRIDWSVEKQTLNEDKNTHMSVRVREESVQGEHRVV